MTAYLILNTVALLIIVAGLYGYTRVTISKPMVYSLAVVLLLTAIFDSLIVRLGIVGYNASRILGVYIFSAPVEDFAYAIASVLTVSLLWEYYDKKS